MLPPFQFFYNPIVLLSANCMSSMPGVPMAVTVQGLQLEALTELNLLTIAQMLNKRDRLSFMATSRRIAVACMSSTGNLRVAIDPRSRWIGTKQVLSWAPNVCLVIMSSKKCPQLKPDQADQRRLSAIDVLLGPPESSSVTGISFPGVRAVEITAPLLTCLVPHAIAATCPNMLTLKLKWRSSFSVRQFVPDSTSGSPPPLVPSLRHLHGIDLRTYAHHSADQLNQQLPNIASLSIEKAATPDLLKAWKSQLTALTLFSDANIPKVRQPYPNLQHLTIHRWEGDPAIISIGPNITSLTLPFHELSETELEQVLALPNLKSLTVRQFAAYDNDWSHHSCSLARVELQLQSAVLAPKLELTHLSKLPLSNVKEFIVIANSEMGLDMLVPDPTQPDSLTVMQRAADLLKAAGGIKVTSCGQGASINWKVPNTGTDEQAAAVLSCAMSAVQPLTTLNIKGIALRSSLLAEAVKWAEGRAACVLAHANSIEPPGVLVALQALPLLERMQIDTRQRGTALTLKTVLDPVARVATHLVLPTGRQLKLEVISWLSHDMYDFRLLNMFLAGALPATVTADVQSVTRSQDGSMTVLTLTLSVGSNVLLNDAGCKTLE